MDNSNSAREIIFDDTGDGDERMKEDVDGAVNIQGDGGAVDNWGDGGAVDNWGDGGAVCNWGDDVSSFISIIESIQSVTLI